MAMSDYDTLAFDAYGQPGDGKIRDFSDEGSCLIYKNWLYVRHTRMWCDGLGWVAPTIAKVDSGHVEIAGFQIDASRGPQSSIFCLVSCSRWLEKEKRMEYRRMAGIGCVGYETPWLKIMKEENLDPSEWKPYSRSIHSDRLDEEKFVFRRGEEEFHETVRPRPEYDTEWVGTKPETYQAFIEWLRDQCTERSDKEWLALVEANPPMRFNQGDAYFDDHGALQAEMTPVGEAKAPMLLQMIQALNEGE